MDSLLPGLTSAPILHPAAVHFPMVGTCRQLWPRFGQWRPRRFGGCLRVEQERQATGHGPRQHGTTRLRGSQYADSLTRAAHDNSRRVPPARIDREVYLRVQRGGRRWSLAHIDDHGSETVFVRAVIRAHSSRHRDLLGSGRLTQKRADPEEDNHEEPAHEALFRECVNPINGGDRPAERPDNR